MDAASFTGAGCADRWETPTTSLAGGGRPAECQPRFRWQGVVVVTARVRIDVGCATLELS